MIDIVGHLLLRLPAPALIPGGATWSSFLGSEAGHGDLDAVPGGLMPTMMPVLRPTRAVRPLVTLAAGIGGVVVAHVVTYVLAISDSRERVLVLHATGHGYLSIAGWVALGAGALAVAVVAARSAAESSGGGPGARVVPRLGALALWQASLFLAAEVCERLAAGAPLGAMVRSHEVLIALGVQLLVAGAVVLVLGGTALVGARLAAARRHSHPDAERSAHPRRPSTVAVGLTRSNGTGARAPPGWPGMIWT